MLGKSQHLSFMKVKIIAEIITDVWVYPDDVLNSDTVGDYKAELDCDVVNSSLQHLLDKKVEGDITILSAEPIEEGIAQYSQMLNNWYPEYQQRMQEYESKRIQPNLG